MRSRGRHTGPRQISRLQHRLMVSGTAIVTTLFLVAVFLIIAGAHRPGASAAAADPYHWPHGVPVGITLSGLQRTHVDLQSLDAQIYASRYDWHANTVRLQVDQNGLVGYDGNEWDQRYMDNVRAAVHYARTIGLTVVINDQSECPKRCGNENAPTWGTRQFWWFMLRYYKNTPGVVFDLFNEPRGISWAQWRSGMQGLVNEVRGDKASNQVWVEGIEWGSTLSDVPMLYGTGIVYTFHHPGSVRKTPTTEASWLARFGWLANRGVPVVDGEFAGHWPWPNPGHAVRQYLSYLQAHHIGFIAWTLQPGSLNSDSSFSSATSEPWGDGAIIKQWMTKEARHG